MIDLKTVADLALLSRIELSEAEKNKLHKDLDSILGYISELEKAPSLTTEKQDLGLVKNVLRDDLPQNSRGEFTEKILKEAPKTQKGCFEVKKILDLNNG